MAEDDQETDYVIKLREDEELEFFMDLAIHETERWIQAVTKKNFQYPDDARKSLENGVLLCELLNCLQPGVIKRINKLPTPIAGLDNINVFLKTCKSKFGLKDGQLFNISDLEDLSQRAIAETDHLKEEYDKRLLGVAITIFWLGKYAKKNYQGPQLDLSAYAAFIHQKQDTTDPVEREQAPVLTTTSQWDWSHGTQARSVANSSSIDLSFQHTRDSSYDSFEKESFDSLDEPDGKMPMTKYSSATALNKTRDSQNFLSFDPIYSNDRNSSLYRSSPDLGNSSSHRRYSSTDSMDGSHNSGGHSRQGSDAQEINYATRRLSTQSSRKSSSSADPLQFVKLKGANDLAYMAEVQMRVAAESKLGASITRAKDDDVDWQSDLSSWKNRRKSQSERSYQLMQDLEQKEEATITAAPKTYSQMQEEREKRKSSGRSFYPIEDGDDDAFASDTLTKLVSSSASLSQTVPKDGIATWAKDSEDEEEDKVNKSNDKKWTKTNGVSSDDQNDKNNNLHDLMKSEDSKKEASKTSSRAKLTDKLRAFDDDDNDASYSKTGDTDKHYQRFKDEPSTYTSAKNSNNSARNSRAWQTKGEDLWDKNAQNSKWAKDSNGDVKKDNESFQNKSDSYGKAKDMFTKSDPVPEKDNTSTKITTVHNVGSRTQNKIGSIMKNFTDSENKVSEPKQGYNERIDLGARKSAFQKDTPDYVPAPVPARRNFGSYPSKDDSGSSSCESEEEVEERANDADSKDSYKEPSHFSPYPPMPPTNPPSLIQKPIAAVAPAILSAPPTRTEDANKKKFVEKTIVISQKANSDKGFGFFLTGGADKDLPITVSKVTIASSADISSLKAKDIILSVNRIDVSDMSTSEVGDIVAKAVGAGYIELKISRDKDEDDSADEEDFSSSDEEYDQKQQAEDHYQNMEMNNDTSFMSQLTAEKAWLEQQIEDTERRDAEDQKQQKVAQELPYVAAAEQKTRAEVPSRLTLSVDRYQDSLDDNLSPSSVHTRNSPSSQILEDDSDGSGPPAILRKWQRQRHKEEYTFDPVSDASETFKRISLNASLPRRSSIEDNKESDRYQVNETNGASYQNWEKRMEEWTQQQDKQRQSDESHDFTDQAKINEENNKLNEKYEQDLRKAEERQEEKKRQEDKARMSQADTARVLEERKAERRARIQQTAAEAAGTLVQKEQPPAPPAKSHTSSVTLNVNRQQQPQYEDAYVIQTQAPPVTVPTSRFLIDPRNQQKPTENGTQFQIKIGVQPTVDKETMLMLEAERERIRMEELKKIEEERKRLEEEQRAKEREKLQALREKEEDVRRQQESLELERQKFLKEQEEFKRLKQQQEHLLQQHQQEQLAQQQEQMLRKQHQEQLLQKQQQEQLLQKQQQEQLLQKQQQEQHFQKQQQLESYSQAQRVQPVAAKRQNASPTLREKSSSTYVTSNSPPKPNYSSQPTYSRSSYSHSMDSSNHYSAPKQNATSKLSKSVESTSSGREEADPTQAGHRFSREQMLAMNRKATPMTALPPETHEITPSDEVSSAAPISREAPSRVELHSLNSVPRAKFRDPSEIYVNISATNPALSPRQTEPNKRHTAPWMEGSDDRKRHTFSAFGDHWLVEEAERRRLAESQNKQPSGKTPPQSSHFTGPIKPATDNRWRGDSSLDASMPQAIRQTLLQKTSGLRGSTPDLAFSSNSSLYSSRSASLPPQENMTRGTSHHNLSSSPMDYQQSYTTQYNQQLQPQSNSRNSFHNDSEAPVNGKQPCSHCSQEIGFGTAMVIEALGLFYHVQCFRCCVCNTSLGSGQQGADVRVRGTKLHCPNCYSNDEAGLKFSKV